MVEEVEKPKAPSSYRRQGSVLTYDTTTSGKIEVEELQNLKASANKFFAEGKYEQSIIGYSFAIKKIHEVAVPSGQHQRTITPQRIAHILKAPGGKSAEAAGILAILYSNRAQAYLFLNKAEKAFADADAAAQIDPKMFKAWYRKGVAASNMGKLYDAMNALKVAVKLDPSSDEAKSLLVELQFKMRNLMPMGF